MRIHPSKAPLVGRARTRGGWSVRSSVVRKRQPGSLERIQPGCNIFSRKLGSCDGRKSRASWTETSTVPCGVLCTRCGFRLLPHAWCTTHAGVAWRMSVGLGLCCGSSRLVRGCEGARCYMYHITIIVSVQVPVQLKTRVHYYSTVIFRTDGSLWFLLLCYVTRRDDGTSEHPYRSRRRARRTLQSKNSNKTWYPRTRSTSPVAVDFFGPEARTKMQGEE